MNIDTSILNHEDVRGYFSKADHRILCGCRATLETLGIPLPDWAQRKPTGPKPGQRFRAAMEADKKKEPCYMYGNHE